MNILHYNIIDTINNVIIMRYNDNMIMTYKYMTSCHITYYISWHNVNTKYYIILIYIWHNDMYKTIDIYVIIHTIDW